jgi:hypothetical protein
MKSTNNPVKGKYYLIYRNRISEKPFTTLKQIYIGKFVIIQHKTRKTYVFRCNREMNSDFCRMATFSEEWQNFYFRNDDEFFELTDEEVFNNIVAKII